MLIGLEVVLIEDFKVGFIGRGFDIISGVLILKLWWFIVFCIILRYLVKYLLDLGWGISLKGIYEILLLLIMVFGLEGFYLLIGYFFLCMLVVYFEFGLM